MLGGPGGAARRKGKGMTSLVTGVCALLVGLTALVASANALVQQVKQLIRDVDTHLYAQDLVASKTSEAVNGNLATALHDIATLKGQVSTMLTTGRAPGPETPPT